MNLRATKRASNRQDCSNGREEVLSRGMMRYDLLLFLIFPRIWYPDAFKGARNLVFFQGWRCDLVTSLVCCKWLSAFFLHVLVARRCRSFCVVVVVLLLLLVLVIQILWHYLFFSLWLPQHVLVVLIPIAVSPACSVLLWLPVSGSCSIAKASYQPAMILHQLFYQNHSPQKYATTLDSIQIRSNPSSLGRWGHRRKSVAWEDPIFAPREWWLYRTKSEEGELCGTLALCGCCGKEKELAQWVLKPWA